MGKSLSSQLSQLQSQTQQETEDQQGEDATPAEQEEDSEPTGTPIDREPRILDVTSAAKAMAQADTTEEYEEAVERSHKADAVREEYGLADREIMNASNPQPEQLQEALSTEARAAARRLTEGNLPDLEKGAMEITTYEILADGTLRVNDEKSGPRYCVGGQYREATGRDVRPVRLRLILPPGGGLSEDMRHAISAADETAKRLAQCIPAYEGMDTGDELEARQRGYIKRLAMAFARAGTETGDLREHMPASVEDTVPLDEVGRVPVKYEPEMRAHQISPSQWLQEWEITFIGAEEALRFTENAGRWHYLGGLVSDGGTVPGTNDPDYTERPYVAVTAEQMSPLSELLGLGPYYDPEEGPIGDGRGFRLLPRWPEDNEHWALDAQVRMVLKPETDSPSYLKGVQQAIKPLAVKNALRTYEAMEGGPEKEYFEGAAKILRTALAQDVPTEVVVRGDQIKVGEPAARGTALVTGTVLGGTFDADPNGRPRAQFPGVTGNQQLTQFLDHNGFALLEDYSEWAIGKIAEDFESIEGIARIASSNSLSRIKEIRAGQGQWQQGRDLLTDAITGGGVRLNTSGQWLKELQPGQSGQVCMTNQIRQRFAGNTRSHLARRVRGLGIDGKGYLHLGVASNQALLQWLWPVEGGKDYVERARQEEGYHTPLADPSAVVHPLKVSRQMGADDDGDIVTGVAANVDVDGQTRKVILNWRFPCVDRPPMWALPEGTPTPWDATSDREAERYRRLIEVFGPTELEDEPAVEDMEVTLLGAENCYQLAGTGARDAINASSISRDASEAAGWEIAERKRKLNRAGPLTRDLERLGDIMAEAGEKAVNARERGQQTAYRHLGETFKDVRDEAGTTSVGTELMLVGHKKETERDIPSPDLQYPTIGYNSPRRIRQVRMPIDYPDDLQNVEALLKGDHDPDDPGYCLETWDGPDGESRHAQLVRELLQGPVQDVIEAFRDIRVDREPFIRAMEKRVRDHLARVKDERGAAALAEEEDRLEKEAAEVQKACQLYRDVWREVMQEISEKREQATDPEAIEEWAEERRAETSRALSAAMKAMSRAFTAPALAKGIAADWSAERQITLETGEQVLRPSNTTAAGMALLAGRQGQVLIPTAESIEPMGPDERHAVVYTPRSEGQIPIDKIGRTVQAQTIRIGEDESPTRAYVRLSTGEEITLYFDSESAVPAPGIEGAVESGEMEALVSRIAPSRGVLRWRVPQA